MLPAKVVSQIISELFVDVIENIGEDAFVHYHNGFYSALQLMSEVQDWNNNQEKFETSLKVAEAFRAYTNTTGGIN